MLVKLKNKLKELSLFRLFVVILAVICLLTFSISYAGFTSKLKGRGEIDVLVYTSELIITNVSQPTIYKNASILSEPTYNENIVNFSFELINTNSTITYDITVKNNGVSNIKYDTTNIISNNSAIIYTLSNISKSTILEPNEELTFSIKICYTEEYKYNFPSSKRDTSSLEFVFQPTLRDKLTPLNGYIEEDSGNVSETEYGASATIHIENPNNFPVSFSFSNSNNFAIYNQEGKEETYTLGANSSQVYNTYIKDKPNAVAVGTNAEIFVVAEMTDYDVTQSVLIDSITLTLPSKGKFQLLSGGYSETPSNVDYTQTVSSGGGIYHTSGIDGENTYYYRGIVKNNYFSFGGILWRILRIDEQANMRLISNDLLKNSSNQVITTQYSSTNSASSLEAANKLVRLVNNPAVASENSTIYGSSSDTSSTTLKGWYNNNIASTDIEKYIIEGTYCQDTEGGNATSSGTSSSVYYYGPYQKIGIDTALYSPELDCAASERVVDKIGLLSVEEYVFAGAAFRTNNTSFFLNDDGITNSWWTMSPGYYDSSQNKIGVFYIDNNGYASDWPDANTTINSFGIRPVITVTGNVEIFGSGTKSNPYHF